MISIVIPAHNEMNSIVNTLNAVTDGEGLTDANIFIVCNGCTDGTELVSQEYIASHTARLAMRNVNIEVISIDLASKIAALNVGLKKAQDFPVILLDADILISGTNIMHLIKFTQDNDLLAAAPKVRFDWRNSNLLARWYYKISSTSSYNVNHRLSNVIALSKAGVMRIGTLPDVIADDEYIRRAFKHHEYAINESIEFIFTCPRNLRNLLKVLTRVERGNFQLAHKGIHDNTEANLSGPSNRSLPAYFVFVACKLFAKLKAKWQLNKGIVQQWERDESNR